MPDPEPKKFCTIRTHLYKGAYNSLLYETRKQYQERFWSCVNKSCGEEDHWEWMGSRDGKRMPLFIFNGIDMYADSLAAIWNKDPDRFEKKKYYDCSVLDCINPHHLMSYNEITNFYYPADCELPEADVIMIKHLYKTLTYTTIELALMYKVSRRIISRIIVSDTKHIHHKLHKYMKT